MIISRPDTINFSERLRVDQKSIKDFVNFTQFALNPHHSQLYLGINSNIYLDPLTNISLSLKRFFLEKNFNNANEQQREIIIRAKRVYDQIIRQAPSSEKFEVLNQLLQDLQNAPDSFAKRALTNWIQKTLFDQSSVDPVSQSDKTTLSIKEVLESGFSLPNENYSRHQIISIAITPHISFQKNIEKLLKSDTMPREDVLQIAAEQVADFCEALKSLDNRSNLSQADKHLIRTSLSIYAFGAEAAIKKEAGGEAALQKAFSEKSFPRPSIAYQKFRE